MKQTPGVKPVIFAAAACAAAAASWRWRSRVMPRRDPARRRFRDFTLTTSDGVRIAARHIEGAGGAALIVAHPAVTGQRYTPLVDFAEAAAEHFDVFTFDFRGHGGSGGRLEMNLGGPLEDLRAVVHEVRGRGYEWVGAVGFSLGGMAAFLLASLDGDLDAVVTVGAPPALPDITPYRRLLPLWSLFLRFLGARFRAVNEGGPLPLEAAACFPAVPLLVVHAENEAFYSRCDLDAMLGILGNKAEFMLVEGAGHTELAGREGEVLEWLVARSPRGIRAGGWESARGAR
ncbi:MAG: alpha/beta fold hydrolase [Actinomycetota bacterium]|nr:alpha/beta fold hydrolase [Actinomycetota bacterium]